MCATIFLLDKAFLVVEGNEGDLDQGKEVGRRRHL